MPHHNSPYSRTPIIGRFLDLYIHRGVAPADDDWIVNSDDPRFEHRPDLLSYHLYGTPDYWWVFGVRNGWEDPVHDLKVGITFYAPSPQRVTEL